MGLKLLLVVLAVVGFGFALVIAKTPDRRAASSTIRGAAIGLGVTMLCIVLIVKLSTSGSSAPPQKDVHPTSSPHRPVHKATKSASPKR